MPFIGGPPSGAPSGSGPAYDEVVAAIKGGDVSKVAILGFSQGGGSTYLLANLLDQTRSDVPSAFGIRFTAYIDAIVNGEFVSETRYPGSSAYHFNIFETSTPIVHGTSIPGAILNVNVNTDTSWGANLGHREIDDDRHVLDLVKYHFTQAAVAR